MKISIGSDHAGYHYKEMIKQSHRDEAAVTPRLYVLRPKQCKKGNAIGGLC